MNALPKRNKEQIIDILEKVQAGMEIVDLCCRHGISDATFYTWLAKYGGKDHAG